MKPKRVIVLAVAMFLLLIAFTPGFEPASAVFEEARLKYPWKIDYINSTNNIRAVATGFEGWPPRSAVIFYNQDTNGFVHASLVGAAQGNCGTNNDWDCEYFFLADQTFVGKYNDFTFFRQSDPFPALGTAVAYYNAVDQGLYISTAWKDAGGQSLGQMKVLDLDSFPGGSITSSPSIAFDQYGTVHLAIAVVSNAYDYLIYSHPVEGVNGTCATMGGDYYLDCDIVVMSGRVSYPSMVIGAEGFPSIAYYDAVNTSLRYAYPDAFQPNCGQDDDWRCITIDDTDNTGLFPSAGYGGETHYIAYYDSTGGSLRLAKFVGSNGNCAQEPGTQIYRWRCDTIDSIGAGRSKVGLSLSMDGAEPLIAYQDASVLHSRLMLAQTVDRAGILTGNCVPLGVFYRWRCEVIDQGLYNLGREVDLAVNPAGLVHIAYLEDHTQVGQFHMKVARQYIPVFLPIIKK